MKKLIAASVVAISVIAALPASAVNGNIEFQGTVIDSGCNVNVAPGHNSSSSSASLIDLKSVDKASMGTSIGITSNKTAFALTLSDCPTNMTSASANFDYQAAAAGEAYLANTQATQNGVGMQLFDDNNGSQALVKGVPSAPVALVNNAAVLPFSVAMVNIQGPGVTAGQVTSSTQYTLVYQ
ncbi:TPA: type 1 fimbrial protein [Klebsiella variicola]|uniref:fimbrial protein n=1 Tax=Klebsiella quasipneumoniae TaxID=1463165 RepID=UPI002B17DCFE|nr:type 1 fimbrial protein [Klebsiella variicola]